MALPRAGDGERAFAELPERRVERIELEVRNIVLGHIQRGGTPSPLDRSLATLMGRRAVDLVAEKKYGHMVALKGMNLTSVPIEKVAKGIKRVSPKSVLVRAARELGISFAAADGSDDYYAALRKKYGAP